METSKSSDKLERNEKGWLLPGQESLNPAGRPAGQSLKEFWKKRLSEMSEEEKEKWTSEQKVAAELIWRMAEGSPHQTSEVELQGDVNLHFHNAFTPSTPDTNSK